MDRFIEYNYYTISNLKRNLKSNMDRFIGFALYTCLSLLSLFKIQYG